MRLPLAALALSLLTLPAFADDPPPAAADMIKDYSGPWTVQNDDGSKICRVELGTEQTIGGYVVTVADGCAKTFPVMDEIAAWRMFEDGQIVFADATRQERLRFYTPDDSYISLKEVDGIVRLVPEGE